MGLFDRFKKKDTPGDKLKTIVYRGGIVRFKIPANWVEEYEEDGGGTFYQNRPAPRPPCRSADFIFFQLYLDTLEKFFYF